MNSLNKTAYEAGVTGNGQYRNSEAVVAGGQKIINHRFRVEAPEQVRNRK